MELFADTRPNADVEYLASAIIKDALIQKFEELFGRDPVDTGPEYPMKVKDARVPSMISDSVDPQIAKMLRASAVEASSETEGAVPLVDNATLLYIITDNDPASISLESVSEYQGMDEVASDATLQAVSDLPSINIANGMGYLSSDRSTIDIGIFVDNTSFAEEFNYRLENAGGEGLSPEKKEDVFNQLYEDLPGGDDIQEPNLRQELLKVVGLTSALTPEEKPAEGQEAPGPEAKAETV